MIAKKLKSLSASFPQVSSQLEHLRKFLEEHSNQFNNNATSYCLNNCVADEPSRYVRALLFS